MSNSRSSDHVLGEAASNCAPGSSSSSTSRPCFAWGDEVMVGCTQTPRAAVPMYWRPNSAPTQAYSHGVARLILEHKPEIVLYGSTVHGRDVAGAVATLVKTGLAADATELSIDPKTRMLQATRPSFGGNLMAPRSGRDLKSGCS